VPDRDAYDPAMTAPQRRARVEDVHEVASSMPHVTVERGSGHNPVYQVGRKSFVFFRTPRPDALDPGTGERLGLGRVVFGSDCPGASATMPLDAWVDAWRAFPETAAEHGASITDDEVAQMLGGTAATLLGIA